MIDAHHHIWMQKDLPWLSGPMQPRIFGDYEAIMRDYIKLVYGSDTDNFGMFDEKRLKTVQDFYVANQIVREAVPITDTFTNEFVK